MSPARKKPTKPVARSNEPADRSARSGGRAAASRSAKTGEGSGHAQAAPSGGEPPALPPVIHDVPLMSDDDIYLFNEGSHFRLHEKLGAHLGEVEGAAGAHFAVWAPDARSVSLIGDFNGWDRTSHALRPVGSSGIWQGFVPGIGKGDVYKYSVEARRGRQPLEKADPFAFHAEVPPRTASVVWDLDYRWGDTEWMKERGARNALDAPMSVYEVHLGSWRRVSSEGERSLRYSEAAQQLTEHCLEMGFTHVELLPVMEHPFYGSWGYQTTGYFAPTSRYGTPQELMELVDRLHQAGIGVILDWVPSHFPDDPHGLAQFDGTHLFEHADPRKGFHPDWKSAVFNYGRHEVRSFLVSSACFWLDHYHADGIRVDAVASMLYLDYSRKEGEWIPNEHGGRENLEAIGFLRRLNEEVYRSFPDVQMIAEESTAWPMVSRPTWLGGLGFGLKWDMGWMHDTLRYMSEDPIHRKYHHGELTFRMIYAYHENYMLPLSHDEVVHGKGSLLGKMPGDDWQKMANLRLLYAYMSTQPGKKLLFMGAEIAQWSEWSHERSLDWHLLEHAPHEGVRRCLQDLNRLYRRERALHELDTEPEGYEWIEGGDSENSCLAYLRRGRAPEDVVLVALNFTPVPRTQYRVGVPLPGRWKELFNSDATEYGGSGHGCMGGVDSTPAGSHGQLHSALLTLPPLGAIVLAPDVAPE